MRPVNCATAQIIFHITSSESTSFPFLNHRLKSPSITVNAAVCTRAFSTPTLYAVPKCARTHTHTHTSQLAKLRVPTRENTKGDHTTPTPLFEPINVTNSKHPHVSCSHRLCINKRIQERYIPFTTYPTVMYMLHGNDSSPRYKVYKKWGTSPFIFQHCRYTTSYLKRLDSFCWTMGGD
jgi:hypothetical protein